MSIHIPFVFENGILCDYHSLFCVVEFFSQILGMSLMLHQKISARVGQLVHSWEQYGTRYALWDPKKANTLQRLKQKKESVVFYDTRLAMCAHLLQRLSELPQKKTIDFFEVDMAPLIHSFEKMAKERIKLYVSFSYLLFSHRLWVSLHSFSLRFHFFVSNPCLDCVCLPEDLHCSSSFLLLSYAVL